MIKKFHLQDPCLPRLNLYRDRKSTRLNSSHSQISYAVFCLKKKKKHYKTPWNSQFLNSNRISTSSATISHRSYPGRSRIPQTQTNPVPAHRTELPGS